MQGILVIGSYNVGLTVMGQQIPKPGETVMGHHFDMGPGGKGSNQAIAIARLGGMVDFMARVGCDLFGQEALKLFEKEGLNQQFISVDEKHHTGAGIIFVNAEGENAIGVAPGANFQFSSADLDQGKAAFEKNHILLIQLETPLPIVTEAIRRARQTGMTVILNPAPAQTLDTELLQQVDILTPNEIEAETLTGVTVTDQASAKRAAMVMLETGVARVIVTMGEAGALLVDGTQQQFFPSYEVNVVDTTGAGDAFNGGLAYALANGESLGEAIPFAAKVAALSVTHIGVVPGLPRKEDINKTSWKKCT